MVGSIQLHLRQDLTICLGKNMGPPYQLAMAHFSTLLSLHTRIWSLFLLLSYYLFVIVTLSLFNLSIKGFTLITTLVTSHGLLFCQFLLPNSSFSTMIISRRSNSLTTCFRNKRIFLCGQIFSIFFFLTMRFNEKVIGFDLCVSSL